MSTFSIRQRTLKSDMPTLQFDFQHTTNNWKSVERGIFETPYDSRLFFSDTILGYL